jgi:hypothetical protein
LFSELICLLSSPTGRLYACCAERSTCPFGWFSRLKGDEPRAGEIGIPEAPAVPGKAGRRPLDALAQPLATGRRLDRDDDGLLVDGVPE